MSRTIISKLTETCKGKQKFAMLLTVNLLLFENKMMKKVKEVSPPGWSGTVKAMKKHKDITNPFALAWSMKNKGAKPHYKPEKKEVFAGIDEPPNLAEDGVGAIAGFNGPAGIPTPKTKKDTMKTLKELSDTSPEITCTHCGGNFDVGKVKGLNCPDCGGTFRVKKENLGFSMGLNNIAKGKREKKKTDNMSVKDIMNEVISPISDMDKRRAVKWLYNNVVKNTNGLFKDEYWEPINKFFKDIRDMGIDIELVGNKYHHNDNGTPDSKWWRFRIQFTTDKYKVGIINGIITAHGAGSVQNPLDKYDISVSMG
jgi:DNA-directed RNA polymerase subunit RPC12/RpoP